MCVYEKEVKSQTVCLSRYCVRSRGSKRQNGRDGGQSEVEYDDGTLHSRRHVCIFSVAVSISLCVIPAVYVRVRACVADLVLWRELLHVGAETPETREEVVDHHLLRNDCTGN